MSVRIGIDLVAIDAVAAAIDRHSTRYLTRVYSADELVACRDADGAPVPERLAARFAAKEAVLKVLRQRDEAIPWRDISISTNRFGAPSIALSGAARAAARQRGVRSFAVSLAHEGPFAAATVLAEVGEAT